MFAMQRRFQCVILLVAWLAISDALSPRASLIADKKILKSSVLVSSEDSSLNSIVEALVQGKGPGMAEVVKVAQSKMDMGDALARLKGKLPSEVTALVGTHEQAAAGGHVGPFSEESLAKALKILNNMIEKAWADLDDEMIKCKEFEDRNRGTFDQVMTDLARIGEQIADLERMRSEAIENINRCDAEFTQISLDLKIQTVNFMKIKFANMQDMTIRKNDLEVMTFVLQLTKCKAAAAGASLAQLRQKHPKSGAHVCSGDSETQDLVLRFDDPKLEAELKQKMTPRALRALQQALGQAVGTQKLSLLEEEPTTATTTTSTMVLLTPPMPQAAVREKVSSEGFWKICKREEEVDCGLLHDTMSLQWGKFKDSVDELQSEMDQNQAAFMTLRADLNAQLSVITVAKGRYMMMLAEVVSNMNANQVEQSKKNQQREELDTQYRKFMAGCKRVITEITFTRICAVVKVRNEVMSHSETIDITDCDVTDWVPGDCSVLCDDGCPSIFGPSDDPYACGGWQTLSREVIVKPNDNGVTCPALSRKRKCNQQKCPVDCEQSDWSGWSKCTKDCEGGVESRTRSILIKPKNGGQSCNTVSEIKPCNTGSCDRDCTLAKWTEWGFCTMACGGGLQERVRKVDIPTRGEGECPKDHSPDRWNERSCNTLDCIGDEICIAKQDLVIAIDGSGSLRSTGFEILQNFAAELVDSYKSEYFGKAAMRIGCVLFGNGEVLDDGTISPAVQVHKLTDDLPAVKTSIKALTWQRGFTNMAQAISLTEKMFLANGRAKAQSALIVITDGKPTLIYETQEKVMEMKDKAVKLFFAPVTEAGGEEIALMKRWASEPWQSHLVHVPGLDALKSAGSIFASKFIATFCPEAMSPSATVIKEKSLGYFLLKESAICGDPSIGSSMGTVKCTEQDEKGCIDECARRVREAQGNPKAFSCGEYAGTLYCYSEVFPVDNAKIAAWQMARGNPDAECDMPMGWVKSYFYDTYVLEETTSL